MDSRGRVAVIAIIDRPDAIDLRRASLDDMTMTSAVSYRLNGRKSMLVIHLKPKIHLLSDMYLFEIAEQTLGCDGTESKHFARSAFVLSASCVSTVVSK